MVHEDHTPSRDRATVLRWAAGLGAVTADALAALQGSTIASARAQLAAAERARQLVRHKPLTARPSLYTLTRAGLAYCGVQGLDPCGVSAANAVHLITCAWAAARLAGLYPDHRIVGERALRREERLRDGRLASALLGGTRGEPVQLHRPDLVLWPDAGDHPGTPAKLAAPVAIEVELTLKAPRRLAEICRAWARCREVAGAIYLAPKPVQGALQRAIGQADASARVIVVPLSALD